MTFRVVALLGQRMFRRKNRLAIRCRLDGLWIADAGRWL